MHFIKGKHLILTAIVLSSIMTACVSTPPFRDAAGKRLPDSIAVIEKVKLGGIDQWIFIRGADIKRPLLLFLHGGPGSPETTMIRSLCPDLERAFVVVHWDQRMSGKTFSKKTPVESITVEHYVQDTLELTAYLQKKFSRDRIYLMGHSWGSILGILTVRKNPAPFQAFIGIGQVVHQEEGEKLSCDFLRTSALKKGDKSTLRKLDKIGTPPYPQKRIVSTLWKQRKLVIRYGGAFYTKESRKKIMRIRHILCQDEYRLGDKINWIRGQVYLCRKIFLDILKIDLRREAPKLEVPVYIFQGIHDYQTPAALAKEYFEKLEAPKKELFLFENSAHSPIFEEPDRFMELMRAKVLDGK